MNSLTHLAIIPARGGSRGIPRKNLEVVGGLPLVARTVQTAVASDVFAAVVVSTDDEEIARVAEAHGGEVVMRPEDLAQDTSPTEPVMGHVLGAIEARRGRAFDSLWLLQPTSPLMRPEDIREARRLLESGRCDSVVGVHVDHPFSWSEVVPGLVEPNYDPACRLRRQDMPAFFRENGALYAIRREVWDGLHVRVGGRVSPLRMPAWRSLDIDSADDLDAARALADLAAQPNALSTARLASIEALALDFDGVLTDNRVIVSESGAESVSCSRGDGMAVSRLRDAGIHAAVFSTETNPVVRHRCRKLDIACFHSLKDKPDAIASWLDTVGVPSSHCAYVGNDVNDLAAMAFAGLAVAPADAHPLAREAAELVLGQPGGKGAVAELAELLLRSR